MTLKPCPFCGSEKVHVSFSTPCLSTDVRGIHCIGCDAFMTTGWFTSTDEELARLWNRRADDASD